MKKPEIIKLEEQRASIAWATESTAGQNDTEGMKKDKNLRGGAARNKSSLIDMLQGLPETIILERHEASNFIAKMTETISKFALEEVLKSLGLTEKDYTISYNSAYNGLSPNGQPNDDGPDLITSIPKLNLKIATEVKHRAEGYTSEPDFSNRFNKFHVPKSNCFNKSNVSENNFIFLFTGYNEENLNKVIGYCNRNNITLIPVDRIPYERENDFFKFSLESLLQWMQNASSKLKGKLYYRLSKLIPRHNNVVYYNHKTSYSNNDSSNAYDRITGLSFPFTNSSMIVSSRVEKECNVFLSNCRGPGSCICNVSNSIHDVPVFQNFIISNRMSPVLFHLTILKQEMSDGKDSSLGDKNFSFNSLTFPNFHLMFPIHHFVLHQTGDVERTTTKSYHHLMNEVNVSTDNIIETEVYPLMFHHHHLFKIVGG